MGLNGISEIEELGEEEPGEEREFHSILAVLEYHNGTMYAWENENYDFLGQGKTMDELHEHVEERAKSLYKTNVRIEFITDDPFLLKNYGANNI